MGFDFFVSYTRANNDKYLRQFVNDLSEAIRDRRPPNEDIGFFDQRDIELGADWDATIVEALQTSGAMVSLLSAAYFERQYCGREYALFRERCSRAVPPGKPLPPLIKPIVWLPFKNTDVPSVLDTPQRTFGDPQAIHNTEGFKYLLKQKRKYGTQYNDLVLALAKQIMAAVDAYPLARLPKVPKLNEVKSAFETASLQGPAPTPTGPKHVRFVYVAASPQRFGNARANEPYKDAGGPDWKPFFPVSQDRVHLVLQPLVSVEMGCTSDELPFGPTLLADIEEAWRQRQIVVILVDGWSVDWDPHYRTVLKLLDQRLDYHWCVLVPWNEQDADSLKRQEEITKAVSETFDRHATLYPNPLYYRDRIKSLEELKAALREVITRLKDEIRKRADVDMPVPPGPTKSILSGPSGQT